MGVLGWIVAPALAGDPATQAFVRLAVLTIGLIWRFIVVLFVVPREAGDLRWSTLKTRHWLNAPRSPVEGVVSKRLWCWLIPLLILTAFSEFSIGGYIGTVWTSAFPVFAEPPGWSKGGFLDSPGRARRWLARGISGRYSSSSRCSTRSREKSCYLGVCCYPA